MAKLTASPNSPAAPVKVTSLSFLGLDPCVFLSFPSSFSDIFAIFSLGKIKLGVGGKSLEGVVSPSAP